jgi:hypothetical protein
LMLLVGNLCINRSIIVWGICLEGLKKHLISLYILLIGKLKKSKGFGRVFFLICSGISASKRQEINHTPFGRILKKKRIFMKVMNLISSQNISNKATFSIHLCFSRFSNQMELNASKR